MHYERSYKDLSREKADEKAIADIMEYLGIERAHVFGDLVAYAVVLEQIPDTKFKVQSLNMMMGMAGISGYPFHAFCRRYCLSKYREWMAAEPNPWSTDEQGFTIYQSE